METSFKEDYLSIMTGAKKLLRRKRLLKRVFLFFVVLALFLTIFSPTSYSSSVKFLSQTSSAARAGGNWSGLAALIGVNLNANTESGEIPPDIYSKIINSVPFQLELMNTPLNFKGMDSTITFQEYYSDYAKTDAVTLVKKYTIGLPGQIVKWIKPKKEGGNNKKIDSLVFLSHNEQRISGILKESLNFGIDETDGMISISATMPEAIPAAQLAQKAQVLLQRAIIDYRIGKAQDQMNFIEQQLSIEYDNYKNAQLKLANYKDRNLFNRTEVSQIELRKLQSEYDLAYSIYSELQRQRIAQNIQVRKDTPIFTTINPATVPLEPVAPNRLKIFVLTLIFGAILTVLLGMSLELYSNLKAAWKKAPSIS